MSVAGGAGGAPRRDPQEGPGAAGLTLAEVLIAAAVLGVAILGMAGAFPTGLRQVGYGGHITKAASLAQQMMEEIRSEPSYALLRYNGKDGRGVATDMPANFPDDWPWSCTAGLSWGEQFCGNTKLTRWRQDVIGDSGDGRRLAQGRGTVTVVDHENLVPGGGAAVSGATTMLRITITVSWTEQTGGQQVTLTSTVPCPRAGCT